MSRDFRPEVLYINEPKLEFRYGQHLEYARDGLYLYGPVDAKPNVTDRRNGATS